MSTIQQQARRLFNELNADEAHTAAALADAGERYEAAAADYFKDFNDEHDAAEVALDAAEVALDAAEVALDAAVQALRSAPTAAVMVDEDRIPLGGPEYDDHGPAPWETERKY